MPPHTNFQEHGTRSPYGRALMVCTGVLLVAGALALWMAWNTWQDNVQLRQTNAILQTPSSDEHSDGTDTPQVLPVDEAQGIPQHKAAYGNAAGSPEGAEVRMPIPAFPDNMPTSNQQKDLPAPMETTSPGSLTTDTSRNDMPSQVPASVPSTIPAARTTEIPAGVPSPAQKTSQDPVPEVSSPASAEGQILTAQQTTARTPSSKSPSMTKPGKTWCHLEADAKGVLFRISGTEHMQASWNLLSNPDRYVLRLTKPWRVRAMSVPPNELLKAIRSGIQPDGTTSVVFDLTRRPHSWRMIQVNPTTIEVRIR